MDPVYFTPHYTVRVAAFTSLLYIRITSIILNDSKYGMEHTEDHDAVDERPELCDVQLENGHIGFDRSEVRKTAHLCEIRHTQASGNDE